MDKNYSFNNQHRMFSFSFNLRSKPSIFFIGFVSISLFMFLDFLYENYRRSGQTLKDYLFSPNSNTVAKFVENNEKDRFNTKYASIISASQLPDLVPTRIVIIL